MSRGPVIRAIAEFTPRFARCWKQLPEDVKRQGREALAALLKPPDQRPARLHFHKMRVHGVDVWSLHLTSDDRYKASLSIVDGVAHMRRCGTHEEVDRNPK